MVLYYWFIEYDNTNVISNPRVDCEKIYCILPGAKVNFYSLLANIVKQYLHFEI